MRVFLVEELEQLWDTLVARLKAGEVGVVPTDTLYGFTADASNHRAVERILSLKQRRTPMSCIPPGIEWAVGLIRPDFQQSFRTNMPSYCGAFTTLWPSHPEPKLHNLVQTEELVGIRQPDHWITELARRSGLALTTTSVNVTGEPPMRSLEDLSHDLREGIDFLVDQGPLEGAPSTLVRCDQDFKQQRRE